MTTGDTNEVTHPITLSAEERMAGENTLTGIIAGNQIAGNTITTMKFKRTYRYTYRFLFGTLWQNIKEDVRKIISRRF